MLLSLIDLFDQYKTIHCKSTNKRSVCNKWYHIYHHSLENLSKLVGKFPKTFFCVLFYKLCTSAKIRRKTSNSHLRIIKMRKVFFHYLQFFMILGGINIMTKYINCENNQCRLKLKESEL